MRPVDPRPAELATLASTGIDSLDGYFSRYLPQLPLAAAVPAAVGARILAADLGLADCHRRVASTGARPDGGDRGGATHRRLTLTGPSGAGKSTVLAALMRTLDPSAGAVYADQVNTLRCGSDDIRSRIAWCGPDTHLFDSRLRENLRLARPSAHDAALVRTLRRVRLGAWFDTLPDGLNARLGAHGTAVSGGERQRLGLARALLADRPVLLDEPTAHLDQRTAGALADDLLDYTADRAALTVTHLPHELAGIPTVRLRGPNLPSTPMTASDRLSDLDRAR